MPSASSALMYPVRSIRKRISSGNVAGSPGALKRLRLLLLRCFGPVPLRLPFALASASCRKGAPLGAVPANGEKWLGSSSGIWFSLSPKLNSLAASSASADLPRSLPALRFGFPEARNPVSASSAALHIRGELAREVRIHHSLRIENELAKRVERHQRARWNQPLRDRRSQRFPRGQAGFKRQPFQRLQRCFADAARRRVDHAVQRHGVVRIANQAQIASRSLISARS